MPLRFVIYPMQFPLLANHAKDTGLSVHGAQRLHGGINQLLDELHGGVRKCAHRSTAGDGLLKLHSGSQFRRQVCR